MVIVKMAIQSCQKLLIQLVLKMNISDQYYDIAIYTYLKIIKFLNSVFILYRNITSLNVLFTSSY